MDTDNHQSSGKKPNEESILIYIVDDEPTLLELAEYILDMEGFRYRKFEDPREALNEFAAADPKPELIITDYVMQGMDGLQLVEECQRIDPSVKSMLVSGTVQEEVVYRSPVKVNVFLRKPYLAQEFVASIKRALDISS